MPSVTPLKHLLVPVCTLLVFSGCVERTVTQTQSSISFSDGPSSPIGDQKKMLDRWYSGNKQLGIESDRFEVNSLNSTNQRVNGKKNQPLKTFEGTKLFEGTKEYATTNASEQKKRSLWDRSSFDGQKEFKTGSSSFDQQSFSDGSKRAYGSGNTYADGNSLSQESQQRVTSADTTLTIDDRGRTSRLPHSKMTEDEVRNLLNPE
ncbi:MAG: hypothetical protein AAF191_19645 [Verrucomicrobiota bacterium]